MFLRTRGWKYLRAAVRDQRGAGRKRASARTEDTGVLNHVAVLPEHQGEGIGTYLVRTLEAAARSAGCDRLVLVTRSNGLAAAHFRATGWSSIGERGTPEGYRLTTFNRVLDDPHRPTGGDAT